MHIYSHLVRRCSMPFLTKCPQTVFSIVYYTLFKNTSAFFKALTRICYSLVLLIQKIYRNSNPVLIQFHIFPFTTPFTICQRLEHYNLKTGNLERGPKYGKNTEYIKCNQKFLKTFWKYHLGRFKNSNTVNSFKM